jgi:uncharacterized protein (DUF2164 family)
MIMDYIEEKTPKGISIKILKDKWKYLAFDRNGSSIYADKHEMKVMHKVLLIAFLGEYFQVHNNYNRELSLIRVSRGKLVIPYDRKGFEKRRYLLMNFEGTLDMVPVRLLGVDTIGNLIRMIESGQYPDYIVVDEYITRNDVVVIKNRCPDIDVVLAEDKKEITEIDKISREGTTEAEERRATDLLKDINLNIMSQNPVFLARVHLRNMDLSKVNQLLLDFDLKSIDAEYILNFINTMLGKVDLKDELKKAESKLESLKKSFQFYLYLLEKKDDEIKMMINEMKNKDELASYGTLLAKIKLLFPEQGDQLLITGYENLIWEMKEKLNI